MKKQEIIFILASAAFLVVFWIGFSVYHNTITTTVGSQLALQTTPINPAFPTEVFDKLKKRQNVSPIFELQSVQTPSPATASASQNVVVKEQSASEAASLEKPASAAAGLEKE